MPCKEGTELMNLGQSKKKVVTQRQWPGTDRHLNVANRLVWSAITLSTSQICTKIPTNCSFFFGQNFNHLVMFNPLSQVQWDMLE